MPSFGDDEDSQLCQDVTTFEDLQKLLWSSIVPHHRPSGSRSLAKVECAFCTKVIKARPGNIHEHLDPEYKKGAGRNTGACKPHFNFVSRHMEVLKEVRRRQEEIDTKAKREKIRTDLVDSHLISTTASSSKLQVSPEDVNMQWGRAFIRRQDLLQGC